MIGTTINLIDNSQIPSMPEEVVTYDNSPIILGAAVTSKGVEKMQIIGEEFFTMYGNPSYKKYGQASIQIADYIKAGGKVLFKRIVADDAALANIVISAKVSKKQVQKVNEEGQPLYKDKTTQAETTDQGDGNEPIMINHALIRFVANSTESASDLDTVMESTDSLLDETGTPGEGKETSITWFTYPLFVIADNGRGVSEKRFRIIPEYEISKRMDYVFYRLEVIESEVVEQCRFRLETDSEYNGESMELTEVSNTNLKQIVCRNLPNFDAFRAKVAEFSGYTLEELEDMPFIFGKNKKKLAIEFIEIDNTNGIDIGIENGLALQNGSDGKLAKGINDKTAGAKEYSDRLVEFFSGEFDDNIFNKDIYSFAACIDANYPEPAKRKIEKLALYRQDFVFYEDLGYDIHSLYDIQTALAKVAKSRYVSVWGTVYDVKDTYSKKQITTTMLYEMTPKLVNHFTNYPSKIFAGYRYNALLERAIEGTVRFVPKILPTENQKEIMEELKVNYAYYYKTDLVVESGWTTQEAYTQLTFVNNMNALLLVLRDLNAFFPRIRYNDLSTTDASKIEDYTEQINSFLISYQNMFDELKFTYVEDKIATANKIYKAKLAFRFTDFGQTEMVDAYAEPPIIEV